MDILAPSSIRQQAKRRYQVDFEFDNKCAYATILDLMMCCSNWASRYIRGMRIEADYLFCKSVNVSIAVV
jgi:hypothetical protein